MASKHTSPSRASLSRASSSGSIATSVQQYSPSSGRRVQQSDEEDSDHGSKAMACSPSKSSSQSNLSYKERRREAHTQAEQKRRDAIKKGYDYLQDLVPTCQQEQPGHKVSKAAVLQKSIDYIQQVQSEKDKQEDELHQLEKEVVALKIMRANYEKLVKAHKAAQPSEECSVVPAEIKFQTFQLLMDSLFQSFHTSVSMANFDELSGCVFSWLEDQCKPQMLQELMYSILQEVRANYHEQQDKVADGRK